MTDKYLPILLYAEEYIKFHLQIIAEKYKSLCPSKSQLCFTPEFLQNSTEKSENSLSCEFYRIISIFLWIFEKLCDIVLC